MEPEIWAGPLLIVCALTAIWALSRRLCRAATRAAEETASRLGLKRSKDGTYTGELDGLEVLLGPNATHRRTNLDQPAGLRLSSTGIVYAAARLERVLPGPVWITSSARQGDSISVGDDTMDKTLTVLAREPAVISAILTAPTVRALVLDPKRPWALEIDETSVYMRVNHLDQIEEGLRAAIALAAAISQARSEGRSPRA